jgi:hypothetical protein
MTNDEQPLELVPSPGNRSSSVAKLAAALAKAQMEMEGATKDAINPHFKSKYADLASVREACKPLSKHGIAILQPTRADGAAVTVTTLLIHDSGEWISEDLTLTAGQATPQAVGSAITYGRRYGLAAMVGIAPEDDDGEAAEGRGSGQRQAPKVETPTPEGYDDWLDDMGAAADNGWPLLSGVFGKSKPEYRKHLTGPDKATWAALRAKAEKVQK